ncbi:CU044_5270 family protein [Spirillospora sp. NPDC047279]|uniref:CU044_5270 family protein n=1 Tax=Spirillospora sp. NPDC047279 TaxID=3155478 RepID=UPI00340CD280
MDEMRMIGTMLDERPPTERSVEMGRARLKQEMRSPRRSPWPARPRVTYAIPALALTTVTAIAVGVYAGTSPRAPDPSGSAPVPTSPRTVLLSAATKLEQSAPPARGKYWHTVEQERALAVASTGRYELTSQIARWDAGPGREAWEADRGLGTRLLGPTTCKKGETACVLPTAAAPTAATTRQRTNGQRLWKVFKGKEKNGSGPTAWTKARSPGGLAYRLPEHGSLTPPDVRTLPQTPAGLRAALRKAQGRLTAADGETHVSPVPWLFGNVRHLSTTPASPKVLGAAYRMLAAEPGLRVVGQVADPLGRKGIAITYSRKNPGDARQEEWLVIDPATGRVLAYQVMVNRTTMISYRANVSSGWTNTIPDYPIFKFGKP